MPENSSSLKNLSLLPFNESLHSSPELLSGHVLRRIAFPASFRHRLPQLPTLFLTTLPSQILRSTPTNLPLSKIIGFHCNSILFISPPRLDYVSNILGTEIGIGFIFRTPRFQKQSDDYNVPERENESRTEDGGGDSPEKITGEVEIEGNLE